jgi:aryl-alcohol dehydrogenase-like predicted oxidoreductase
MMDFRQHKDFIISEVGFGCYGLSGVYGKEPQDYEHTIQKAYELGINFFDTAEAYGGAEEILGEVVQPFRGEIYIATKVGVREGMKPDLSPVYVKEACEQSLKRLNVDYIDLYQIHFDDPETPVEDTLGALESLVEKGLVRHYGVGHISADRVNEYNEKGSLFSILMELSAVARHSLHELLPLCRKNNLAAIAFSVTGRGILTGKIGESTAFSQGDIRRLDPLFKRERFESALKTLELFKSLGAKYGKSPVQVAIAWVLNQPGVVCALTGPSSLEHLEENIGGSGWHLEEPDLKVLEHFFIEEDTRLASEQKVSIRSLLTGPSPADPNMAFQDLVYVCETAILIGMASEAEVIPIFRDLFALRDTLESEEVRLNLKDFQRKLKAVILN